MGHPSLRLAVSLSLALVGLLLAGAPAPGAGGSELEGRYVATSVTKEDVPYDFWRRSKLRVEINRAHGQNGVSWHSGCNFSGADFEVSDERIVTGEILSTEMACAPPKRQRQDEFFLRFFDRDPAYLKQGNGLTLRAGKVIVELQRRPE